MTNCHASSLGATLNRIFHLCKRVTTVICFTSRLKKLNSHLYCSMRNKVFFWSTSLLLASLVCALLWSQYIVTGTFWWNLFHSFMLHEYWSPILIHMRTVTQWYIIISSILHSLLSSDVNSITVLYVSMKGTFTYWKILCELRLTCYNKNNYLNL